LKNNFTFNVDEIISELETVAGKKYELININTIPCDEISDKSVLETLPTVSVAMITYNHEAYIAEAIECIINQKTEYPFELVIGEDCSTDNTKKIVLEYQKKYPDIIRVLFSEENVGMHKNMLRVEKNSRGKYIAYCEGDDYWHCMDKLQLQLSYLESQPQVGLVYSKGFVYNIKTREKTIAQPIAVYEEMDSKAAIELLMRDNGHFILTCSVVIRKNLLAEFYEDPLLLSNLWAIADFQRWAMVISQSRAVFMDENFVTYNLLPESASQSLNERKSLVFFKKNRILGRYMIYKLSLSNNLLQQKEYQSGNILLSYAFKLNDKKSALDAYDLIKLNGHPTIIHKLKRLGTTSITLNILMKSFYHSVRFILNKLT
jgi:glycosyltransferase involved in cell wall biosynthesis